MGAEVLQPEPPSRWYSHGQNGFPGYHRLALLNFCFGGSFLFFHIVCIHVVGMGNNFAGVPGVQK